MGIFKPLRRDLKDLKKRMKKSYIKYMKNNKVLKIIGGGLSTSAAIALALKGHQMKQINKKNPLMNDLDNLRGMFNEKQMRHHVLNEGEGVGLIDVEGPMQQSAKRKELDQYFN